MKHKRLLVYEGDKKWMDSQLSNSLPEGKKRINTGTGSPGSITVYVVSDGNCVLEKLKVVIVRLLDKLIHQQRG